MNVKIKDNDIRFKITQKELNALLDGDNLNAELSLLNKNLIFIINQDINHGNPELRINNLDNTTSLKLILPHNELIKLNAMGKSKGGLKYSINNVTVVIQVDIRGDKREVTKQ